MAEDFRASQIQTNQIISSGSNGTGAKIIFYDITGQSTVSPNQGIIDPSAFGTGSIGQDIFFYVSGGIGDKNSSNQSIATFGGDVHVSGNLSVDGDLNGNKAFRLSVADYVTTTNTSSNPEVVGQVIFNGTEFSGSLTLRAILNSATVSGSAVIQLFELTTGSFVEIGGPGDIDLAVTGTTPTVVESVNLYDAAGFVTGGLAQYELRLYTATSGVTAFAGGAELRPDGSFSGKTIITESFTTQFISGTTAFRLGFNDFINTTNTSSNPAVAGQLIFPADEFSGSLTFRAVLSTINSAQTASVRLFNASSGSYVELQAGQDTLSTTNTAPTIVESQNLFEAVNFNTSSAAVYEMHVHTSDASANALAGGGELRPSGSFRGLTVITSSTNFVSGTWVDDNSRLRTTASVAISGEAEFADAIGQDVYFYVSGTLTSGSATDNVAVFGGSVRVSGNLAIGSGSVLITEDQILLPNGNVIEGRAGQGTVFQSGLSGSLTSLSDGKPYLLAGDSITLATNSLGQIEVSGSGGGGSSLQQAYLTGSTITVNSSTGSVIVTGDAGANTGILLLRATDTRKTSLEIQGTSNSSNIKMYGGTAFGQAELLFKSVGDNSSRIAWKNDANPDPNSGNDDGAIYYHDNGVTLHIVNGNNLGYVAIDNGGAFGGDIALFRNSSNSGADPHKGGVVRFFTSNPGIVEVSGNLSVTERVARFRQGLISDGNGSSELTDYGTDVSNFFSGAIGGKNTVSASVTVFGGDTLISGGLFVEDNAVFSTISEPGEAKGQDVYFYVSGVIGGKDTFLNSIALFGGDVHISGNLTVDGTSPGAGSDGDWTLTGSTLYSTSSIVVGQQTTTNAIGEDVFLFVSGTFGSGSAGDAVSVFGGDVRISGTLAVGTGSTFIKESSITFGSASIQNIGGQLRFFDTDNTDGQTLQQLASGGSGLFFSNTAAVIEQSGSLQLSGSGLFKSGLTGALNELPDGAPYLAAGANITLSTGSNGQITIGAVTGSAGAAGSTNEIQYNLAGALTASNNFWIQPGTRVNVTGGVNMSGDLTVGGGVRYTTTFVTASRTLATSEYRVGVSASAQLTLTLPGTPQNGQSFVVKDIAGNANSNNIIVSSSGDQIDGAATYTIAINYGSAEFTYFAGANSWGVI